MMKRLPQLCLAEFIGTYILVFFGVGSVHAAVLTGAQSGLWQVAIVWGVAISLAIYALGAVSGAHINPAMTLAFAAWRGFPKAKIAPFILAQVVGGFAAGMLAYAVYHGMLIDFEAAKHITRGAAGSELSAMMFGEYFPNPTTTIRPESVPVLIGFLAEAVGTGILAASIFAFTENRNSVTPQFLTPLLIGLTVAILICLFGTVTQAGFNPARDFGPRLASYVLGWGNIAIPGPRGGFFVVYILAPIVGAIVGSGLYQHVLRSYLSTEGDTVAASELVEVA
jgi:glycerol uptake facilitator protein